MSASPPGYWLTRSRRPADRRLTRSWPAASESALTRCLTRRLAALDPAERPLADALTGLLEHLVADG